MKPLIYYAHSKLDYNTKREEEEIKFLSQYYKVFNPNTELGELGTMAPYLHAVCMCHHVVVSPHKDLYVGRGVFHEICIALAHGQAVQVLCKGEVNFALMSLLGVCFYDTNDWKVYYGKIQVVT